MGRFFFDFESAQVKTKPDAVSLPEQAFDAKGDIKPEFYEVSTIVAYPEGHSVWSKIELPEGSADWKVSDLKAWLSDEHKLSLTAWNLPCGEVTDSDGEKRAVSARVYPAPVAVDLRKLPSLELSKPQAMMALQKQRVGGLMMKYLSEWSRYKQLGSLPDNIPEPERSTAEMTLREILEVKGKMQLGHKRRVILDGLSCSVTRASPSAMDTDAPNEEEFDVEKLAPVLLKL